MKKTLMILSMLTLTASCAVKQEAAPASLTEPSAAERAPVEAADEAPKEEALEAEPPSGVEDNRVAGEVMPQEKAAPSCTTAECKSNCAKAGDRIAACALAFEKGCFSDQLPKDFDCDWNAPSEQDSAAPKGRRKHPAPVDKKDAKPKKSEPPAANLETIIDG